MTVVARPRVGTTAGCSSQPPEIEDEQPAPGALAKSLLARTMVIVCEQVKTGLGASAGVPTRPDDGIGRECSGGDALRADAGQGRSGRREQWTGLAKGVRSHRPDVLGKGTEGR